MEEDHRGGHREKDAGNSTQVSHRPQPTCAPAHLSPCKQQGVSSLVEAPTHHLRGGGVSGKVVHSRRR